LTDGRTADGVDLSRNNEMYYLSYEPPTKCIQLRSVDNFSERSDVFDWKPDDIRARVLLTFQLRLGLVLSH